MKKYKIINKKRFYFFMTFAFLILFGVIILSFNSIRAHSEVHIQDYREVYIYEGDTLWDLAVEYMPSQYDTRYLVYKIKEFNSMTTAQIYAGTTIKIPIFD